tara:strand:+ start:1028 stop:3100 length:2073 start_codon:yes stop_codon:yes gene_type:complete
MPYIGNTIRAADDYRLIDDISSGFNGSTTSFALQVAGSAPVPFPKSPQQVLISVNGVIQEPDPTGASGFNLVGTNIVFSSAPTNGHAFFGIIYATADYLNAGGNFPAGSLGAPSITFIGDENSGLFRKSGGSVGFVSDATEIANFDSNGITISSGNLIIPDSIIHNGDANTKIRFPAVDTVTIETAGSERLRVDSSGNVGIGTTGPARNLEVKGASGDPVHFKLEGDPADYARIMFADGTDDNIGEIRYNFGSDFMSFTANATERMRIDSSGRVGIGTTSPGSYNGGFDNFVIRGSGNTGLTISTDDNSFGQICFSNAEDAHVSGAIQYRNSDNILELRAGESNGAVIFSTVSNTERMRIDSSGNVGIGITDPDQKVEVAGVVAGNDLMVGRTANRFPIIQRHTVSAGSQSLTITAGAGLTTNSTSAPTLNDALNGAAIQIVGGNPTSDVFGGGIRYYANGHTSPNNPGTGNQHVFYRRSAANTFTEAVRITHTGHFKASTEGNYVDITGNYHESFTNTNNQHIHWFQHSGSTQAQQFGIRVRTGDDGNDSNALIQASSGSATAGLILRNGSFQSRNNSFGGISDIKLKENIVDAKSQWDDIKAIKFRNFNFKDNPTQKMLGVVAQEIELVSAGLVEDIPDRDPDTNEDLGTVTKHVKSSILYMKAMKCLQEAMAKIEVLETEVAALKAA